MTAAGRWCLAIGQGAFGGMPYFVNVETQNLGISLPARL